LKTDFTSEKSSETLI